MQLTQRSRNVTDWFAKPVRLRQHGWFADNTPLTRGESEPPFIDAYNLFLAKVERNIRSLENNYSVFERRGEKPNEALARFSVLRANVAESNPEIYGIKPNSIGGIITSPSYLCMFDYSLGQRLYYAWLFPGYMERDFNEEIGARRRRSNPAKALQDYLENMNKFAKLCEMTVRPGGGSPCDGGARINQV